MSVQTVPSKPKERRLSVNVSMTVVHKTNRSEDKKLERRVEHLKQKEHQDQVRHGSEVRKLEKELETMQLQVESADRTFTKRETEERDVPYLFGKKMAAQQPRATRRRRSRGDSVAWDGEMTGENRFRSAVVAVSAAKILGGNGADEPVQDPFDMDSRSETASENLSNGGVLQRRVSFSASSCSNSQRGRMRMRSYPTDRPFTSPAKPLSRRSTGLCPASTSDEHGNRASGFNTARSVARRNTMSAVSMLRPTDSPSPTPSVSLPDLVCAARASIVHAAESAKAASVLKRRGSAVNTVTAAERDLERRRSSAALRMQEIKNDISRRDVNLQDRIKLFVKTNMPGECQQRSLSTRRISVIPVGSEISNADSDVD